MFGGAGLTQRRSQVSNIKRWRVSGGISERPIKNVHLKVSVSELSEGRK